MTGPTSSRTALAVDLIPPRTRLLLLIAELEPLVAAVEERRRIRLRCDELLRDALAYRSPPEQEMDDRLDATRLLLLQHGFIPRGLRGPLAPEEVTGTGDFVEEKWPSRDIVRARVATALAREIRLTLHPDINSRAPALLDEDEIAEAIARAKAADLLGNAEMAYEALLETLPKYFVKKAQQLVLHGAASESDESATIHGLWRMCWFTMQPGRRLADLPYPNLNGAKIDAMRMRTEADRLTLAHAYALAYAAAEDVLTYRRTKPTDEVGLQTMRETLTEMASVGHDLWVTEATTEESLNANILVKRLHVGVGREVREIGNAVYHMARVLTPDVVYPESIAGAAATLRRAVSWVDNALTQFKMELRAAEHRMREPSASAMQRSNISGLYTARGS